MTQPFHTPHHGPHRLAERWKAAAADRRARATARRWRHFGTEPRWARSDLPARRLLGRIFVPFFFTLLAANALPAPRADRAFFTGLAVLCAVSTVVAVIDLIVIRRRLAEQRRWHR